MPPAPDITALLHRWNEGDDRARDQLMPLLYDELGRLARARMRKERPEHTLGTTGLVHEAYLKLVDLANIRWNNRGHFLALLSRVMRRILVDHARARDAARRGGKQQRVELDEARLVPDEQIEAVLELEEALTQLEAHHPRPAQALAHCYFGGLTNEEAAEAIGVSRATVERDLRFARAWLASELGNEVGLTVQ